MRIPFGLAVVLAALAGFIALTYEILWARVYSFTSASRAVAFGTMLSSYLLGLALGSLLGRRWQRDPPDPETDRLVLSRLFILSGIAAFAVVPIVSWGVVSVHWGKTLPVVVVGAGLFGALLPVICHAAVLPDKHSGARVSYLYFANFVGAGFGALLTGFVLLESLALWQITMTLLILAVLAGVLISFRAARGGFPNITLGIFATILALCSAPLHDGLYERLQQRASYDPKDRFTEIVESRHGVITVDRDKRVYGGGTYDGMLEVRPTAGGGLIRPLFVSAVHANPQEILVIGMSGGAWTQVLANHPQARHVTAVEINGGYLDVIKNHPEVSSLLSNPKVSIFIDDGRRWLRRNSERKFDLIVMNGSFYWREFSSALLSQEFLELLRSRLNPDGVVLWNLSGSGRAAKTGLTVFPHTMMVMNTCVGSMTPITVDLARWRDVLSRYQIDGAPVFDLDTPAGQQALDEMLAVAGPNDVTGTLMTRHTMEGLFGASRLITDDNLGEEYNFVYSNHPSLERFFFWR